MAESPRQVLDFLRELAGKARPFAERDLAELQTFAREELGIDNLESWDIAYASEKLRAEALRLFRPGSEAVFPRAQGAGWAVPGHRNPLSRQAGSGHRAGLAPGRALLPHRPRRRTGRPVLSRPLRARNQARRRLDGRGDHPAARPATRTDAGGLPQLQLLRHRWAANRPASPTTKSSPCSTSSATACTTC